MRQRRIAGAENAVGPALDTELGLERRLHVNVGQHAETLGLERLGHALHGIVKTVLQLHMKTVHRHLLCR